MAFISGIAQCNQCLHYCIVTIVYRDLWQNVPLQFFRVIPVVCEIVVGYFAGYINISFILSIQLFMNIRIIADVLCSGPISLVTLAFICQFWQLWGSGVCTASQHPPYPGQFRYVLLGRLHGESTPRHHSHCWRVLLPVTRPPLCWQHWRECIQTWIRRTPECEPFF